MLAWTVFALAGACVVAMSEVDQKAYIRMAAACQDYAADLLRVADVDSCDRAALTLVHKAAAVLASHPPDGDAKTFEELLRALGDQADVLVQREEGKLNGTVAKPVWHRPFKMLDQYRRLWEKRDGGAAEEGVAVDLDPVTQRFKDAQRRWSSELQRVTMNAVRTTRADVIRINTTIQDINDGVRNSQQMIITASENLYHQIAALHKPIYGNLTAIKTMTKSIDDKVIGSKKEIMERANELDGSITNAASEMKRELSRIQTETGLIKESITASQDTIGKKLEIAIQGVNRTVLGRLSDIKEMTERIDDKVTGSKQEIMERANELDGSIKDATSEMKRELSRIQTETKRIEERITASQGTIGNKLEIAIQDVNRTVLGRLSDIKEMTKTIADNVAGSNQAFTETRKQLDGSIKNATSEMTRAVNSIKIETEYVKNGVEANQRAIETKSKLLHNAIQSVNRTICGRLSSITKVTGRIDGNVVDNKKEIAKTASRLDDAIKDATSQITNELSSIKKEAGRIEVANRETIETKSNELGNAFQSVNRTISGQLTSINKMAGRITDDVRASKQEITKTAGHMVGAIKNATSEMTNELRIIQTNAERIKESVRANQNTISKQSNAMKAGIVAYLVAPHLKTLTQTHSWTGRSMPWRSSLPGFKKPAAPIKKQVKVPDFLANGKRAWQRSTVMQKAMVVGGVAAASTAGALALSGLPSRPAAQPSARSSRTTAPQTVTEPPKRPTITIAAIIAAGVAVLAAIAIGVVIACRRSRRTLIGARLPADVHF